MEENRVRVPQFVRGGHLLRGDARAVPRPPALHRGLRHPLHRREGEGAHPGRALALAAHTQHSEDNQSYSYVIHCIHS